MRSNRLQLNADKTEVMWCASARRQSQLLRCPISVAGASVEPVSVVRDLGVFIDSDLDAAKNRITATAASPSASIRHQRLLPFSCGVAGAF